MTIRVLQPSRHTLDSLGLLASGKRRGDEPWFVLTGAPVGSVVRPNPAGREAEAAGMLFGSLHARLPMLPDHVAPFQGFRPATRAAPGFRASHHRAPVRKRFNTAFKHADMDASVRRPESDMPPPPSAIARMVAANLAA